MFNSFWSRRLFLKASLAGAILLAVDNPAFSKAFINRRLPEGKLSLYNTHLKERLTVNYRDLSGNYIPDGVKSINHILRCHYTGEVASMDIRLIEYLNIIDKKLGGGNEFEIISGYRSPKYNLLLSHEGHHVARHSLHMKAKAIDISIPGEGLNHLRRLATKLNFGGVGYYPGAGFVHIDTGTIRTWGS